MTKPISIVVADDHEMVRDGLRAYLAGHDGLSVVGEAPNGEEAVRTTHRLRPDVLVLDLMLPGMSGLEVIQRVQRETPGTRILVLTILDTVALVSTAFEYGALGFVRKAGPTADLLAGVKAVAAGRRFLAPPLSEEVLRDYQERTRGAPEDGMAHLTDRELEVLRLTADGLNSGTIARQLSISPRTVETHRARAMQKLGLRNRSELIRFALKRGMLLLD